MRNKYIVSVIIIMFLVSCSKPPLVTEEYNKAIVLNTLTNEVLYETSEKEKIKQIIKHINTSKRTDTFNTLGTSIELIFTNGDKEQELKATYYTDKARNGNIIINHHYVYTSFQFLD